MTDEFIEVGTATNYMMANEEEEEYTYMGKDVGSEEAVYERIKALGIKDSVTESAMYGSIWDAYDALKK